MAPVGFPYTGVTYADARTQLAAKLDDPYMTFWTDAELGLYIKEALQTYQAYSATWRQRITAPLTPEEPFYDLNDVATDLCARDTEDRTVLTALTYKLMEAIIDWTATPPTWDGTDMFALADLTNAIQARVSLFILETGMVITRTARLVVPPTPIGRVPLPDTTLDVRRAAWVGVADTDIPINLWKDSEFAFNQFQRGWSTTPATPTAMSIVGPPPISLQLMPPPVDAGSLDLLTLDAGALLDPTNTSTLLNIPNDFIWVIQFGALVDLLSRDGQSKDPARAAYCQQRWDEGCSLARIASSVLYAAVNGVQVDVIALMDLDQFSVGWQGVYETPTLLAMAGYTLFALSPVPPESSVLALTLDVVQNAPLPAEDDSYLQVSRDAFDVVLNYAQHLAAFKQGAYELHATLPYKNDLIKLALTQNMRLRADALYIGPIGDQTTKESKRRPFRDPEPTPPLQFAEAGE